MANCYLIPITDALEQDSFIKKISANNIEEAQDKIINFVLNDWDWEDDIDTGNSYEEFQANMAKENLYIGYPVDIESI